MEKPFTITSYPRRQEIADRLRRAGCDADDDAAIYASLLSLAQFLEHRRLTTRQLIEQGELIGSREFVLNSRDLTPLGIDVIRAGFGAWEKKGYPAKDLRPLEKAYTKLNDVSRKTESE